MLNINFRLAFTASDRPCLCPKQVKGRTLLPRIIFSQRKKKKLFKVKASWDFPGGAVVKNLPANAGTRVRALVWKDPTCCGATKPVRHNYWACALKPTSHNYWAHVPQLLKPARLEPVLHTREATAMRSPHTTKKSSPRSPQLEKARAQQQRPNAVINK